MFIPIIERISSNLEKNDITTHNEISEVLIVLFLSMGAILFFRVLFIINNPLFDIIWKNFFMVILPFVLFRKYGLSSFGISKINLKKHMIISGTLILVIGSIFTVMYFSIHPFSNLSIFIQYVISGFVFYLLAAGLPEEFVFRVFIQTRLTNLTKSFYVGIMVSSLIFGLFHVPILFLYTHDLVLSVVNSIVFQAVVGIVLGYLWERTKNIIEPILFHAAIDAFIVLLLI